MNTLRLKGVRLFTMAGVLSLAAWGALPVNAQTPADPYANGAAITIGAGPGEYNFPASGSKVYGGANGGTLLGTNITIGPTAKTTIQEIHGGSNGGTVTGEAKVTYNGATVPDLQSSTTGYNAYHLYGGSNGGTADSVSLTMNGGWVRGWVAASLGGAISGDSHVTVNGGLVGSNLATFSGGQGEVYGGAANATVSGDTYVTISGGIFNPATYRPGDANFTVIRQHVLGGGFQNSNAAAPGNVTGDTHVNVVGGSVFGHVCGAGGGGDGSLANTVGNTHVVISGGEIGVLNPDANGSNIYGGGYGGRNSVTGNTSVYVTGTARIKGHVYGGGKTKLLSSFNNTIGGNASVLIDGGIIGGNVYAGSEAIALYSSSTVNGTATVTLRNIDNGNSFVQNFGVTQSLMPGKVTGASAAVFDHVTADFQGMVGSNATAGLFTDLSFVGNTLMDINPAANYYAKNWLIETGSTVNLKNTAALQKQETFRNGGLLSLNAMAYTSQNIRLTMPGSYTSLANGQLSLDATDNTVKDYLAITQSAKKDGGNKTQILLNLNQSWSGARIDLVEADAGSELDAFTMNTITLQSGRKAVLQSEVSGAKTFWYIAEAAYVLTYDGNHSDDDSAAPVDNTSYAYNASATVQDKGALVKSGYKFTGWNTSADGSGTAHAASSSITMAGDQTLYAQWQPLYKVTVIGGVLTGSGLTEGLFGQNDQVAIRAMTPPGMQFVGWTTGDGVVFQNDAALDTLFVMPNHDVTVTAVFAMQAQGLSGGTPIPTLGEWGLLALIGLLLWGARRQLRRR